MYIKQGDLFWGMSRDFVENAMNSADRITPREGEFLFREGDVADHFFILTKGRVKLFIGDAGQVVYMARHPGEIVGWSSIIGRGTYSASAQCMEEVSLLKLDRDRFLSLLEKEPSNEVILFKRLSEMLGNRLIEIYPNVA